jgi:hypothetical protein
MMIKAIIAMLLIILLIAFFIIVTSFLIRISFLLTSDMDSLCYEDQRSRTIILLKLRKLGIVLYK